MLIAQREESPKYQQIREVISKRISSGEWPEGYQLPPERVLAETYDISRVTVRSALSELVYQGVLERQHGRGTYVASQVPQTMNDLILLVCVPPHGDVESDPFFSEILGVMSRTAAETRCSFAITPLSPTESFARYLERHPNQLSHAAGVAFLNYSPADSEILMLRKQEVPHVLIGYSESREHVPFVTGDHEDAMFQAASHLLKHGCRRLAVIDGPWSSRVSQERLNGYMRALREADVPFDASLLVETSAWDKEAGKAAIEKLFAQTDDADAILSAGDWSSFGAIHALQARGIQVPAQMPIIIFGIFPWLQAVLPFEPTYSKEDLQLLAKQAMAMLEEQKAGFSLPGRYQRIKLDLVIGTSCGCQRK